MRAEEGEKKFQEKIREFLKQNSVWEVPSSSKFNEGGAVLDEEKNREKDEEIYWEILKEKIIDLNSDINSLDDSELAIESLKTKIQKDNFIQRNKEFDKLLRRGIKFKRHDQNGDIEPIIADIVDFENPEKNDLKLVDELTYTGGERRDKFDFVLLVNGIPLIFVETKSRSNGNVDDAVEDIKKYEQTSPDFFNSVLFNVSMTEHKIKVGSVGAPKRHNYYWRRLEGKKAKSIEIIPELFDPYLLLDILKNYVFYEKTEEGTAKLVPRYMQYRASSKVVEVTKNGDLDRGLIWHTQGSGKSLTMLFSAQKILSDVQNSQVILVVDTDNLRGQMKDDLTNYNFNRDIFTVIESDQKKKELEEKIRSGMNKLILTTIHTFEDQDYDIQGAENTIVMSDEAHRFEEGDLGIDLENALPKAQRFGFTGTPVRINQRDTFDFFQPKSLDRKYLDLYSNEDYLDRYSMEEGIDDQLILPVDFNVAYPEWDLNVEKIDEHFESITEPYSGDDIHELLVDEYGSSKIGELDFRVEEYSKFIAEHFESNLEPKGYKGMVVTPSRDSAVMYAEKLEDMLGEDKVNVVISQSNDKGKDKYVDEVAKEVNKEKIRRNFKRDENPKILVVMNMFLTGFDAPKLKTVYLDRNLNNHKLLQTIARTNRPYFDEELGIGKGEGVIIDFRNVYENLDSAFDNTKTKRKNGIKSREEQIVEFENLLDMIYSMIESYETVSDAAYEIEKNSEIGEEFSEKFKKVSEKYFSLFPFDDSEVNTEEIFSKYKSAKNVYEYYQNSPGAKSNGNEKYNTGKIDSIIESNANVSIEETSVKFTLDSENAAKLESDPKTKILKKKTKLEGDSNQMGKRYEKLSEKLKDTLSNWRDGENEEKILDDLENLEEEVDKTNRVREERNFNNREYAVFQLLTEEYGEHFEEKEAENFSRKIEEQFTTKIDTDYSGWRQNLKTRKNIKEIVRNLALEKPEFFKQKGWLEEIAKIYIESPKLEN